MISATAPTSAQPPPDASGVFSLTELRRVGTAATMLVIGGTAIIIVMTMALGHYNSLAHALPKAVLDGAVVALLIGRRGRWRSLALLGTVYGLVLLLQIGVVYLLPVMAVAGVVAALVGRVAGLAHRAIAVILAAVVYEVLAGFGAPLKIHFGTGGAHEPFVWGLWFAEWPLRIAGAAAGVWLAQRSAHDVSATRGEGSTGSTPMAVRTPPRDRRIVARGRGAAAIRLAASVVACVLPMMLESGVALGAVALAAVAYALWAGLRWRIVHVMAGLFWGWLIFGVLSYLWHQDTGRAVDMLRTFVLRFMPLTLASLVLVTTARPVDVIRVLRRIGVGGVVLIPVAGVVRSIPRSRREMNDAIARLRHEGVWRGPWSLLRRPVRISRHLLGPQLRRWRHELAEADGR